MKDLRGTPTATFRDLTPLSVALSSTLAKCRPVTSQARTLADALGYVSAEDVRAPRALPACRIALRDGFMVAACETTGATPYSPVYPGGVLRAVRAGEPLEAMYDAVLPETAATVGAIGMEVLQSVAPGSDTRAPGEDCGPESVLLGVGCRARASQLAVLALAGISDVRLRIPRIHIAGGGPLGPMIAALAVSEGARSADSEAVADVIVRFGEPGEAAAAAAARQMAAAGTLIAGSLALHPGSDIALGVAPRPDGAPSVILVVPARPADAIAAWTTILRPCLAALAGAKTPAPGEARPLSRKVVSAPGVADLVLLRRTSLPGLSWEPLATGDLPWSALAAADAFCLVPPESEGLPAQTVVVGYPL